MFGIGKGFGVEVGQMALRAARLKRGRIEMVGSAELPAGVLLDSFIEPNVADMPAFVDALKRLLGSLGRRGGGVGVALPDYVSRVSVMDFDSLQGKEEETGRMIRWRLKKLIPFDVDQAELRYQYLGRFRFGEKEQHRFLVSIIRSEILSQYEAAFREAGARASRVGIASFAVWNLFHDHVMKEAGDAANFALMNILGGKMTVIVFDHGLPHFMRLKDLGKLDPETGGGPSVTRIARELTASLTFYKENYGHVPVGRVFVAGDFAGAGGLAGELGRNSVLEVRTLDMEKVVEGGSGLAAYSAACGAAAES
jgi:Tfp pilus assembly PilM family ATPase